MADAAPDGRDNRILEWLPGRGGVHETAGGFHRQGSRTLGMQVEAKHLRPEAVATMLELRTG